MVVVDVTRYSWFSRTRVRRRRTPCESSASASSVSTSASVRAETDWPELPKCWSSWQGRLLSSPRVSDSGVDGSQLAVGSYSMDYSICIMFSLSDCFCSMFHHSPLHSAILRYPQKWKDCCPLHRPWSQGRGDPGEGTQGEEVCDTTHIRKRNQACPRRWFWACVVFNLFFLFFHSLPAGAWVWIEKEQLLRHRKLWLRHSGAHRSGHQVRPQHWYLRTGLLRGEWGTRVLWFWFMMLRAGWWWFFLFLFVWFFVFFFEGGREVAVILWLSNFSCYTDPAR